MLFNAERVWIIFVAIPLMRVPIRVLIYVTGFEMRSSAQWYVHSTCNIKPSVPGQLANMSSRCCQNQRGFSHQLLAIPLSCSITYDQECASYPLQTEPLQTFENVPQYTRLHLSKTSLCICMYQLACALQNSRQPSIMED